MSELEYEVARDLILAQERGNPIEPVRNRISGADQAYAVQRRMIETWLGAGRRIVGHKIGLTSKVVQAQIGVSEPDFGTLFDDMARGDGSLVSRTSVIQPRVEGEIAFVLKSDIAGVVTPEQVIAATDYICPAIEICDSRIRDWDIRLEDTLADNASSCLFVLGKKRSVPKLDDLAASRMTFKSDGKVVGEGGGIECMGNPAHAVAWLALALDRFGLKLGAGDVVLSGALSKMISAKPGMEFEADFGALGTVSIGFER